MVIHPLGPVFREVIYLFILNLFQRGTLFDVLLWLTIVDTETRVIILATEESYLLFRDFVA